MRRVIAEYHIESGNIVTVRTFDAEDIPIQPCRPGHAAIHVDGHYEPKLAQEIQFKSFLYRVNHATKDFELKVRQGER